MMISKKISNDKLFSTVVENGFCIGCGACAAFDESIQIKFDESGRYVATRKPGIQPVDASLRVCPFADGVPNEDALAREAFGPKIPLDPHIGYNVSNYAGWVVESDFRSKGSSGGMVSWVLVELLERGLVDYVINVTPNSSSENGSPLFNFSISSTSTEVRSGSKSRYYPVEMSGVIREMLKRPGRYAVVGIPCFIKAIRLSSRESSVLRERLAFCISIVCGHLKSTAFAESFAWQCGVAPGELKAIDFRTKLPDRPANSYAVTVTGIQCGHPTTVTKPTSELFGANWGHGFFKYKACDFCDDVVGETADISLGDAWLPEYESDSAGTNVVVVRSRVLNTLLADAAGKGRLHLESISAEKVHESQSGGFRHRRDGLSYRLFLEDQKGDWRPKKRVEPSEKHLTKKLKKIYRSRYELGQLSLSAFAEAKAKGDFGLFLQIMKPMVTQYDNLYRRSYPFRILGRIKRITFKVIDIIKTKNQNVK